MREIEGMWDKAARVWWLWRGIVLGTLFGLLAGTVIGFSAGIVLTVVGIRDLTQLRAVSLGLMLMLPTHRYWDAGDGQGRATGFGPEIADFRLAVVPPETDGRLVR